MQVIVGIEAALQHPYPGYFDMSVVEMDEYLRQLTPDPMEIAEKEVLAPAPSISPPLPIDKESTVCQCISHRCHCATVYCTQFTASTRAYCVTALLRSFVWLRQYGTGYRNHPYTRNTCSGLYCRIRL